MNNWTAWVAGAALVTLGSALSAQNTPAPAPARQRRPRPRPAGPPPTPVLGDGPWDLQSQEAKLHVEVVSKGLDHPWGMAFVPDGSILVTERPGRLRVIRNGRARPDPDRRACRRSTPRASPGSPTSCSTRTSPATG
jgi:glucose/arabinose dehydrogenase